MAHWILDEGVILPGGAGTNRLWKKEIRPAVKSDDGVTIMWTSTIPEPGIYTFVYYVNDLEAIFYATIDYRVNTPIISIAIPAVPYDYNKISYDKNGNITRTEYALTPSDIQSIKEHFREALVFWIRYPSSPFVSVDASENPKIELNF